VLRARHLRAQPDPREDVRVVALPRHVRLPVHHHRVERAPARKQTLALAPRERLLRRALRLRRRVRQRHDDRPLVQLAHQVHHLLAEHPRLRAHPNDPRRLQRLDRFNEVLDLRVLVCVRNLVVLQARQARFHHQPLRVH